MMVRRGLAALLVALLAVPAAASPSPGTPAVATPIGTFSFSDTTFIGGATALAGTTVFSGDYIEVGPRGSAGILLKGGMQVRVSSDSRLRLKEISPANQIELEMLRGAVRFRTSQASPVLARLADAVVRAKGANPAIGIVSVLSKSKAMIGAEKGELLVTTAHDAKSVTLREGEAVEVTLEDAPPPSPGQPQSGNKTTNAHALTGPQIATIGGLISAAVMSIGLWLAKNNDGLTDTQKNNMISPFKLP
jgi:hypothetical protein